MTHICDKKVARHGRADATQKVGKDLFGNRGNNNTIWERSLTRVSGRKFPFRSTYEFK